MTFDELNIAAPILAALKSEGYTSPTPIQAQAIPLILNRKDILGCAQTGTGKTAAFAIPMIQLMSEDASSGRKQIKSLILTPTRELAIQIGESFANYGKNSPLSHLVIFGGVNQHAQVQALKKGVDILVATPGRLLDLMNQGYIDLNHIKYFVLDEADRMLDMGFVHDVKKVIKVLPSKRQSLFFSATMPKAIVELADTILHQPAKVEVTPVSSTADTIGQQVYFVDKGNKKDLLLHILKDSDIDRVLVFSRTKHGADKIAKQLNRENITTQAIHGNKSQNARQNALSNFKDNKTRVLVATDIAARGIDIDELSHVINYDLPNIAESYVHRIGRTGRAGAKGKAISFCDAEEKAYLSDIQKLIGKKIPVVDEHPYPLMNHHVEKKAKAQAPKNRNRTTGVGPNSRNPAKKHDSKKHAYGGNKSYGGNSSKGKTSFRRNDRG